MMDVQNVLIPGGGGAAGIGAIKSLKMCKHQGKIVASDSNLLSAGFYLADKGYVVPPANSPSFFREAMKLLEKEEIEVILPTSGYDILPYSKNKKILEKKNIIPVVSDYAILEHCLNKMKFYEVLQKRFDLPYTTTNPAEINAYPCVVKPIFGKGSKNISICKNEADVHKALALKEPMLLQEYLPGIEYTIDVLSDLEGNPLLAVPRERVEIKAGISSKGRIVFNTEIQNECLRLAKYLGIQGPSCMQMKCDSEGRPKIMEVNPRLGGATIMATYAGVNFPELILKLVNSGDIELPTIKNISMIRYYSEIILDAKGKLVKV